MLSFAPPPYQIENLLNELKRFDTRSYQNPVICPCLKRVSACLPPEISMPLFHLYWGTRIHKALIEVSMTNSQQCYIICSLPKQWRKGMHHKMKILLHWHLSCLHFTNKTQCKEQFMNCISASCSQFLSYSETLILPFRPTNIVFVLCIWAKEWSFEGQWKCQYKTKVNEHQWGYPIYQF